VIQFSVILPTFEQAAFIGRALDSLLAQTCSSWELILVRPVLQRDNLARSSRPRGWRANWTSACSSATCGNWPASCATSR
jgi:hypothetical protein